MSDNNEIMPDCDLPCVATTYPPMTDTRRKAAEEWAETHCPSCGMPRATDVDWKRHDEGGECSNGCECVKCCSVCWDEFSCQSGDDSDAVTCHLAGQECGEQRAVEGIVLWLKDKYRLQTAQLADLPTRIERGEWKEEK